MVKVTDEEKERFSLMNTAIEALGWPAEAGRRRSG